MTSSCPPKLVASEIQSAIAVALPTFKGLSPCYRIHEGSEHNVWCVGASLVVRSLPATGRSDGKSEVSLRRDRATSRLLRRYISNPHSVPEVYATIAVNGWICNVERRIHGKSLEEVDPQARTEEDLAVFLKDLASVTIEETRLAVGCEESSPNMTKRIGKAVGAWSELVRWGYTCDSSGKMHRILKQKLALLNTLNRSGDEPVLLHADISGEHILVGTEGEVNGIIDWSDAIVGDPCRDIAGISLAVGQLMARRIGLKASYSQHTVEKGLLYAMCLAITNLCERICGSDDSPEHLLRRQFKRAFDGTGVEHVLLPVNVVLTS